MDLESAMDMMCMGMEVVNFRFVRVEIAIRKQNFRIRSNEAVADSGSSDQGGVDDQGGAFPGASFSSGTGVSGGL